MCLGVSQGYLDHSNHPPPAPHPDEHDPGLSECQSAGSAQQLRIHSKASIFGRLALIVVFELSNLDVTPVETPELERTEIRELELLVYCKPEIDSMMTALGTVLEWEDADYAGTDAAVDDLGVATAAMLATGRIAGLQGCTAVGIESILAEGKSIADTVEEVAYSC